MPSSRARRYSDAQRKDDEHEHAGVGGENGAVSLRSKMSSVDESVACSIRVAG